MLPERRLRRREAMDGESGAEAERSFAQDVRSKRPQRQYVGRVTDNVALTNMAERPVFVEEEIHEDAGDRCDEPSAVTVPKPRAHESGDT